MSTAPAETPNGHLELNGDRVRLRWQRQEDGWHVIEAGAKGDGGWVALPSRSGWNTVLYVNRNPAADLVQVDKEGVAYPFYPSDAQKRDDGSIIFKQELPIGTATSEWKLDPQFPSDVQVNFTLVTSKRGRFSLAAPTLAVIAPEEMAWGMVPGNWYGDAVQENFELSPHYSLGVPNRPYLAHERNSMTLCPLVSTRSGLTLGVIPDPDMATDPWQSDKSTRDEWRMALGTMNRYGQLTPMLYRPVLGQEGSLVDEKATLQLNFRYSLQAAPWFSVFRHAAEDVYHFSDMLNLQTSRESLAERTVRLAHMLADDKRSGWKVVKLAGQEIGANGTKTSDIGAMFMLGQTTDNATLRGRLQFLRTYKLLQQQTSPGFFQNAATGEYPEGNAFAAERGNWIEPLFTTYYTLLDIGNMSLFSPKDDELKRRIRLAADKLAQWQHPDGSFDVAYDSVSHLSAFPQLTDVRPTWYGFVVAYRILGDEKYLAAARRGADWYLEHAVKPGHYLGACGDALNIWDFTTVFGSQALLDLYTASGDEKYKTAAIKVARVYATSIFTHPIATDAQKTVAGEAKKDWEITQVGLSVEHIRGTANSGPVLLSSHAGLFVRMYELTGEQLFLDMARSAARGRQHFTDPETGMAVYYWNAVDKVAKMAKLFPWHAEWQVGWITDYLLSEAHLRSKGQIHFTGGFPTPKVGSHVAYGFDSGKIFGRSADLLLGHSGVTCGNPNVECIPALSADGKTLFVIVLNQMPSEQQAVVEIDPSAKFHSHQFDPKKVQVIGGDPTVGGPAQVKMRPWGYSVLAFEALPAAL